MSIAIGTITVEQGEKRTGMFETAETNEGTPIETPVHIVNGTEDGPTIWVQGCIHGNEYVGTAAILDVWKEIDPNDISGAIIFVPAVNITAFRHGQRGSPHEKKYILDLNRVFPGKANGKFTLHIAHDIFEIFMEHVDYFLDFHCGSHPDTRWALYPNVGEVGDQSADLGRAVGFPYLLETELDGEALPLESSMLLQGALNGVPGVIVESGAKDLVDEDARIDAIQAIYNFAGELDVLNIEPDPLTDEVIEFSEWAIPTATRGGRLFCYLEPGDEFKSDEIIGHIEDFDGEVVEEISAPFSGHVLMSNNSPFIGTGTEIYQLANVS